MFVGKKLGQVLVPGKMVAVRFGLSCHTGLGTWAWGLSACGIRSLGARASAVLVLRRAGGGFLPAGR